MASKKITATERKEVKELIALLVNEDNDEKADIKALVNLMNAGFDSPKVKKHLQYACRMLKLEYDDGQLADKAPSDIIQALVELLFERQRARYEVRNSFFLIPLNS